MRSACVWTADRQRTAPVNLKSSPRSFPVHPFSFCCRMTGRLGTLQQRDSSQTGTVWLLHSKGLHFNAKPRTLAFLSGLSGSCFEVFLPWDVRHTSVPFLKPDVFYPHLHEEPFVLAGPLPHPWMPEEAKGEDSEPAVIRGWVHLSQSQGPPTSVPDSG